MLGSVLNLRLLQARGQIMIQMVPKMVRQVQGQEAAQVATRRWWSTGN